VQFRKIRYDGTVVTLELHDQPSDQREVDQVVTSREAPHRDFQQALNAFIAPSLALLELGGCADYDRGIHVQSVAVSHDKDGFRGCVVTMLKSLGTVAEPWCFNTPHVSERSWGAVESTMSRAMQAALTGLEREAQLYLEGKRLQGDLFEGELTPAGALVGAGV